LQRSSDPGAEQELNLFCRQYREPVYRFVCLMGVGAADAEDLTQTFFLEFLSLQTLKKADPARGRFRTFLLACLRQHLHRNLRTQNRLKRGGGVPHIPIEDAETSVDAASEAAFDREWARTVLDRALQRLEQEYEKKGRPFARLRPYLESPDQAPSLTQTARELDISVSALKSALFRMRKQYSETVREEIARTVAPEQVDSELEALYRALMDPEP